LSGSENITTNVLLKICKALNCDIIDIMEIEQEQEDIKEGKDSV